MVSCPGEVYEGPTISVKHNGMVWIGLTGSGDWQVLVCLEEVNKYICSKKYEILLTSWRTVRFLRWDPQGGFSLRINHDFYQDNAKTNSTFWFSYPSTFFCPKTGQSFFFLCAVADIVRYVSTIKIRCWSKISFIRHQYTQLYNEEQIAMFPGEIS